MNPLQTELSRRIRNPLGTLVEESRLRELLRRRLTKKEYRILLARAEGTPTDSELMQRLRLDEKRLIALDASVSKKLNRDSIKRELYRAS